MQNCNISLYPYNDTMQNCNTSLYPYNDMLHQPERAEIRVKGSGSGRGGALHLPWRLQRLQRFRELYKNRNYRKNQRLQISRSLCGKCFLQKWHRLCRGLVPAQNQYARPNCQAL